MSVQYARTPGWACCWHFSGSGPGLQAFGVPGLYFVGWPRPSCRPGLLSLRVGLVIEVRSFALVAQLFQQFVRQHQLVPLASPRCVWPIATQKSINPRRLSPTQVLQFDGLLYPRNFQLRGLLV